MAKLLVGREREQALSTIAENHYTGSVPSGKTHAFQNKEAIILFSIPANPYVSQWLVGRRKVVWELSRLWAPDGHRKNLLTETMREAIILLREQEPSVEALISYADPNVGHAGGVYKAANWFYLGPCEDGRYYRSPEGRVVARRAFHSGRSFLRKQDILDLGYTEEKKPGRHRYAKGLTRRARALIRSKAKPYQPAPGIVSAMKRLDTEFAHLTAVVRRSHG